MFIRQMMCALLLSSSFLLMTACATVSEQTADEQTAWPSSAQWQAKGVVGIKTDRGAETVYVTWLQRGEHFQLSFMSQLGTHIGRLSGEPGNVTLITADGKSQRASTPDQLADKLLGWSLPVSGLRYWIRGLPAPGNYRKSTPTQWQQHGWQIDYQDYQTIDNMKLPYRLVLQRPGIRLHIIIKEWQVGEIPTHS